MTVDGPGDSDGRDDPDGRRDPVAVRVVRGLIAVLVWGALSLPISGMFRWVGEVLAMPPSYGPAWKFFVGAVGVVLFFAFVLEPYRGDEVSDGADGRTQPADDTPRDDGAAGPPPWSGGDA